MNTFSFTDRLYNILIQVLKDPIANTLLDMETDGKTPVNNGLDIEKVDISKNDWEFDVKILGDISSMKCGKFIRHFIPGKFSDKEIYDFCAKYNRVRRGLSPSNEILPSYKKVEVPVFKFNPLDIRSTFISLTTKTYPYGHEEEVLRFLPTGLEKDQFGNYYRIIGKSETMFTSHLDTADRNQTNVALYSFEENGDEIFVTDGGSIMGADDKSGVSVMLYMMSNNVPGIYYFFIGEEVGGIGSNKVSSVFDSFKHLNNVKRCISFDRRNYYSVITSQLGRQCCSDKFASELAKEINKSGLRLGLDPTGIYTDSASFIDDIPECTNISVGYFSEHTSKEKQNITFLEKLAKACINVNWESLPTIRKVGFNEEIIRKYRKFLTEFKLVVFSLETKIVSDQGDIYIKMDLDDNDIDTVHNDILSLSVLLNKHRMDPDIYFDYSYIKIKLD